jgi:hypothetical protein
VAGVTCDGQHTITGATGQQTDCAPYTCNPSGCLTACENVQDCVSPAVCNDSNQCVLPASADTGSSGGCATSPRRSSSPEGIASCFGLLALSGWLRRRRR